MTTTDTPWGTETIVLTTEMPYGDDYGMLAVKKIDIDTDEMTSYHKHNHKTEIITLETGMVEIRLEDDYITLEAGDAYVIEAGTPHQLQNIGGEIADITEVGIPFDPDDINRIEDPYADTR